MGPKITLFSRDKKKKVLIQSVDSSSPTVPLKQPEEEQKGAESDAILKDSVPLTVTETKPVTEMEKSSNEIYWHTPMIRSVRKKRKRDKQEIFSMFLSIIGAILVGVIMGFSILSIFFTNESTYSKNSIDSHLYLPKREDQKSLQRSEEVYLLQAGIFQHRAGAEEKVRSYRKQGLAAIISATSPYRIYLGISFDRKGAYQLAKAYQAKGINVYIKKQTIAFGRPNNRDSLSSWIHRSSSIVKELSRLSIEGLSKEGSIHLQPQIEKEYQQILAEANRRKEHLSKSEKAKMMKLLQALDQAVQGANESKVNPSQALMFQIQEGLVRYVNRIQPQ